MCVKIHYWRILVYLLFIIKINHFKVTTEGRDAIKSIEDLTKVTFHMKFIYKIFDKLNRFHMKWP